MQFDYNADYPAVDPQTGTPLASPPVAASPPEFPAVQPIPCARITTRVFSPQRNQVATVQNVLVKTIGGTSGPLASGGGGDNVSWSTDSDDDMSSSTSGGGNGTAGGMESSNTARATSVTGGVPILAGILPGNAAAPTTWTDPDRAYWIQRTIREAIYGRVWMAVVLQRRPRQLGPDTCEWEVTTEFCAVKEMSWQHIRRERNRLAEDPIKEVAAMQYLKAWHAQQKRQQQQQQQSANAPQAFESVQESFRIILETNIMMPLDLLTDDRHMYSIMPYCDGGELFERLDMNERFTEPEARYWMYQVLNGIENLQKAGICHRDMSLENLLVHRNGALIIDMGMCLRIPQPASSSQPQQSPSHPQQTLTASFGNLTVNGSNQPLYNNNTTATTINNNNVSNVPPSLAASLPTAPFVRNRCLLGPQGTCGKWIYMSPEIYKNATPFDGFAVDMWAAGVILFLMLTGFPPWERACLTDERFKYMTAGYLVQMLTEWEIGLSGDAMDLLQRMLFLDPKDRLSLAQVRAHPWMTQGPTQAPMSDL